MEKEKEKERENLPNLHKESKSDRSRLTSTPKLEKNDY